MMVRPTEAPLDREQGQSALQTVSAWASEHRLMLGQMKVEEKSNEITAIPALLELLDLSGCIITIDAMGTQTEIAGKIIEARADYVLTLKGNHPTLYAQVTNWFESAQAQGFAGIDYSYDERVEAGHHRLETRPRLVRPPRGDGRPLPTRPMGWSANYS